MYAAPSSVHSKQACVTYWQSCHALQISKHCKHSLPSRVCKLPWFAHHAPVC
jgi:hypothetical protein